MVNSLGKSLAFCVKAIAVLATWSVKATKPTVAALSERGSVIAYERKGESSSRRTPLMLGKREAVARVCGVWFRMPLR